MSRLSILGNSMQAAEFSCLHVCRSDVLISLHNFALLEDKGFPEALAKLSASDLTNIATNLARALKPGVLPTDARDAAARLSNYEAMAAPLIDAGVLTSLVLFLPTVKPFNRLPPAIWGPEALREINNTLQVGGPMGHGVGGPVKGCRGSLPPTPLPSSCPVPPLL